MSETYEVLYTDYLSNCEEGDIVRLPWIDEDGETFIDQIHIRDIDVDSTITVRGYSDVTNESDTREVKGDPIVEVLGG